MRADSSFVEDLDRAFDRTVRIRWSYKLNEWHIEEKVGRAIVPPIRIDPDDDDLIRAKDGYAYVLTVRNGDRMPCPKCRMTLKVPMFEFGHVKCQGCQGRFPAGFFSLNHRLIEYLRKIHRTNRDFKKITKQVDHNNAILEMAKQRQLNNSLEDSVKDNWNKLWQNTSVGYTGKEFKNGNISDSRTS